MPQDPLTQLVAQRAATQDQPEPSAWSKAETIGASRPGERYAEPTNPTALDLIRRVIAGPARPSSVAAQDPYGISAWMKGAGPVPGLALGTTEESQFLPGMDKAVSGVKTAMGDIPPLLKAIFAKNPEAEGVYSRAMATQVPEALAAKQAAGASRYANQANAHDALLDLHVSGRPHPIPTDTGWSTAIPLDSIKNPMSAIRGGAPTIGVSRDVAASAATPAVTMNMAGRSGLTLQDIQKIRQMDPVQAIKVYPELKKSGLLSKIYQGDVYGDVK